LLCWYKSANTDAARRIADDAASMDDEEEMIRESQGLLDEEEVSAEEEERRMSSKVCSYTKPLNTFSHVCARMRPYADVCLRAQVCSYTKTSNTFSEQHWYHCWTCGLTLQEGCCAVCVKVG